MLLPAIQEYVAGVQLLPALSERAGTRAVSVSSPSTVSLPLYVPLHRTGAAGVAVSAYEPSATFGRVKWPVASVVTEATGVPATWTVALASGLPVTSRTVPDTACEATALRAKSSVACSPVVTVTPDLAPSA